MRPAPGPARTLRERLEREKLVLDFAAGCVAAGERVSEEVLAQMADLERAILDVTIEELGVEQITVAAVARYRAMGSALETEGGSSCSNS